MSNSKKAQVATCTSAGKFSLTRKIAEFFKLGDDGKLDSFFSRITKKLSSQVDAHERNLGNLEFTHNQKIDVLNDQLTDAEEALADAFLKVDIEKITSNADQDAFAESYLSNISLHEAKVKAIESAIEAENKSYDSQSSAIQKQVDAIKTRIATISQE